MKKIISLLITISVTTAMSFSGFDLESIATLIHVAKHQHGVSSGHSNHGDGDHHDSDHHHYDSELQISYDHDEDSRDESQLVKKGENLKAIHQHSEGDGHSGEPHDHTINLSSSIVALVKELPRTNLALIEEIKYSPPYIQKRTSSPDLNGLFRPPKC